MLKVVKSAPYTVMEVEVGIPDNKPLEGEPSRWGADEGTRLEDLELEVRVFALYVAPSHVLFLFLSHLLTSALERRML